MNTSAAILRSNTWSIPIKHKQRLALHNSQQRKIEKHSANKYGMFLYFWLLIGLDGSKPLDSSLRKQISSRSSCFRLMMSLFLLRFQKRCYFDQQLAGFLAHCLLKVQLLKASEGSASEGCSCWADWSSLCGCSLCEDCSLDCSLPSDFSCVDAWLEGDSCSLGCS